MRFECFNKRAQAGEVAYERLILTAGQVPAAQKAARAMGGNDWAATCACHGTRYNISLLDSTLRPKISKLGNFFRDHAVKAGSIVTGTCDPTIPSVTLAAKQAAGAGGGVVAAPAAQLGVAPLPPLPLQQQQQKRPLSAKWQRGHAQKPSLVAPERHTAPASRPGTEFVSLLSDEEEGPQQQQPQQQQQQQAGATVRAAASAAAGAPACAEAGPGPALHQLSLAGRVPGQLKEGRKAQRARELYRADAEAAAAAGRPTQVALNAMLRKARQEGPGFDLAAAIHKQQQHSKALADGRAAAAADDASGAVHEGELLLALRKAVDLTRQQQPLPNELRQQLYELLAHRVPATRLYAASPQAPEMLEGARQLMLALQPRPLSEEEQQKLQLADELLPAVAALLGKSACQSVAHASIGASGAITLHSLPPAAYQDGRAHGCRFAAIKGQLQLRGGKGLDGKHVQCTLAGLGMQDLRHAMHVLDAVAVPPGQAGQKELLAVLHLFVPGMRKPQGAAAAAPGGGGGGGGSRRFVLSNTGGDCPAACVAPGHTGVFSTSRNAAMAACAKRARSGMAQAAVQQQCSCWTVEPRNWLLPLPPPGQPSQRCNPVLLCSDPVLRRELDRWAAAGNLPGVTSVQLPSGDLHELQTTAVVEVGE